MKKVPRRISIGIMIVLCVVASVRIYGQIQIAKDKKAEIIVYEMGEVVPLENDVIYDTYMTGYSVTVLDAQILTTEKFCDKYDANPAEIGKSYYTPKVYDVEVKIENTDNEDTGINLWDWKIQNNAALAGTNDIYYRIANKDKGYTATAIAVKPGTAVTMHVIFSIPELNFTKYAYEHIEDENMKLVVTLYPTKKMIKLQE